MGQLTGLLNVRTEELPDRVGSLVARLRDAEKELGALRQAQLLAAAASLAGRRDRGHHACRGARRR
ncbi:hypothetical protein NKG05_27665 [Oerskovia sp. M15]